MPEPILVTGGAGYIGSHVCKALAQDGFLPIAYDNLSTGHAYAVKWGPFVEGDLNDRVKLQHTLSFYKPKAVMHFAADAIVVESMHSPAKYYRNNVSSSIALLEAMQKEGIRNLVFSSTCATYGIPSTLPITESHSQAPINPYGRSKWIIEQILGDFEAIYGFNCAKLRYFNAAGADLKTEIGEDHQPETHLIPNIIHAALDAKKEIVVYGTDFPTPDGSAVRDYIHVQDLAQAHLMALKAILGGEKSFAVNLGTGQGYSVLEIIEAVQTYCGKSLAVRLDQRRAGEPPALVASAGRAKELLGWEPQFSGLSVLIDSAWKWHKLLSDNAALLQSTLQRLESRVNQPL